MMILYFILGPVIPEVTSIWFKMYIYHVCQAGPPSLLLPKGMPKLQFYTTVLVLCICDYNFLSNFVLHSGYKITRLPRIFENYTRLLVTVSFFKLYILT